MVSHFVGCSTAPFEGNAGCPTSSAPITIRFIGSTNGKPQPPDTGRDRNQVRPLRSTVSSVRGKANRHRSTGVFGAACFRDPRQSRTVDPYIRHQWLRDFPKTLDCSGIRSHLSRLPIKSAGACVLGCCALRGSDRFTPTVSIRQRRVKIRNHRRRWQSRARTGAETRSLSSSMLPRSEPQFLNLV